MAGSRASLWGPRGQSSNKDTSAWSKEAASTARNGQSVPDVLGLRWPLQGGDQTCPLWTPHPCELPHSMALCGCSPLCLVQCELTIDSQDRAPRRRHRLRPHRVPQSRHRKQLRPLGATVSGHGRTLFKNPFRTWEALTDRNRGIRMGFSRMTADGAGWGGPCEKPLRALWDPAPTSYSPEA